MPGTRILSLIFAAALLAGCKTTLQTNINATDLVLDGKTQITGTLNAQVVECKDGNRPSESIEKARKYVSYVFSDAKYIKCEKVVEKTYAVFALNVHLVRGGKDAPMSDNHISFLTDKQTLLAIAVPEAVRKRIAEVESDFSEGELEWGFSINLNNNTRNKLDFVAISSSINDKSFKQVNVSMPPGLALNIKPSYGSTFDAISNGYSVILRY